MINEDTAKNLVIMPCENIKDISLPVLARNVLELMNMVYHLLHYA